MIGTTLSHYRITEKLGAGGMGEVYRAEDTNLDRQVAIKVLPDTFSGDPERLARFEREAKLLASLNHPNIAAIHGLEEAGGKRFLVLELVEGETLAQRIAKGPLPVDETLDVCRQIAEGLEAAHEKGIIHRDLKPANVKITPEGKVKVLDFGLAKAFQEEVSAPDATHSPTITKAMTQPGVVLGTAAYMSPEQAKGKAVDKRADVWAFGCILYECLTAKRAFEGETVTETLAAILKGEPDWNVLPVEIPPSIGTLLRRCLQKDPFLRFHDIADIRIEITDPTARPVSAPRTQAIMARRLSLRMVALLILATAGITTMLSMLILQNKYYSEPPRALVQLPFLLPSDQKLTNTGRHAVAVSPDGKYLAYSANSQIRIKPLFQPGDDVGIGGAGDPRAAQFSPFFSPDGEWIGYYAQLKLWKAPVRGGQARPLCDCSLPFGVTWEPNDVIVFGQGQKGIWKVSAEGGKPELLVPVDSSKGEIAHGPQLLKGGNAVLYTLGTSGAPWSDARIILQDLMSSERYVLVEGGTDARYIPTGHLVYVRDGTLWGRAFEPDRPKSQGKAVPLLESVGESLGGATGAAQFSFSGNGILASMPTTITSIKRNLVWVNRRGEFVQAVKDIQPFWLLSLSSDGTRAAVILQSQRSELWVYDLKSSRPAWPLRRGETVWNPLFTPDGSRVAFSLRNSIYLIASDGGPRNPECLVTRTGTQGPYSFSSSGDYLFLQDEGKGDIAVVSVKEAREARTILDTGNVEAMPAISPDGRWIAYTSDRTGAREIWVASYPDLKDDRRLSFNGGWEPRWSRDSRELYFWQSRSMMAVGRNSENKFSVPAELFKGNYEGAGTNWPTYAVAPDGRFLMIRDAETASQQPSPQKINIIVNWFEELKRLVPTGKK